MNIGVIFGGRSVEHDVSIITGLQVINNLDKNKYKIIPIYLDHNNIMYYSKHFTNFDNFKNKKYFKSIYTLVNTIGGTYLQPITKKFQKRKKIDLIFNCTHGFGVEDGTVSALLQFLNIPTTSSKILSSSVTQDKDYTKIILKDINIPVVEYIVVKKNQTNNLKELTNNLTYPKIVKPAHLGSSIGINKANNQEELIEKIKHAFIYDEKVIIEPFLENFKEYAVAVYKRKNILHISNCEIINNTNTIFNFNEKYLNHHKTTKHIYLEDKDKLNQIKDYACNSYNKLEMDGIVRFDFIENEQKIYLNEINTIPGAMANYLFEEQLTFKLLLDEQIRQAFFKKEEDNSYLTIYNSNILNETKFNLKK